MTVLLPQFKAGNGAFNIFKKAIRGYAIASAYYECLH